MVTVSTAPLRPPAPDMRGRDVFASPLLYLYYYGGEERAVHRSVIERDAEGNGGFSHSGGEDDEGVSVKGVLCDVGLVGTFFDFVRWNERVADVGHCCMQ